MFFSLTTSQTVSSLTTSLTTTGCKNTSLTKGRPSLFWKEHQPFLFWHLLCIGLLTNCIHTLIHMYSLVYICCELICLLTFKGLCFVSILFLFQNSEHWYAFFCLARVLEFDSLGSDWFLKLNVSQSPSWLSSVWNWKSDYLGKWPVVVGRKGSIWEESIASHLGNLLSMASTHRLGDLGFRG